MEDIKIRMATVDDAKQINSIYEKYVLETGVTFEIEPVPIDEFKNRIAKTLECFPYIVCEINEKIVGYAYLAAFKERAAFGWNTEITVYVDSRYHRRNIGKAFYEALIPIAKKLGYVNIIAEITTENEKSCKMHESMGFQTVCNLPGAGFKLGKWWGLCIMSKQIGSIEDAPRRLRSIHEISKEQLEQILIEASNKVLRSK